LDSLVGRRADAQIQEPRALEVWMLTLTPGATAQVRKLLAQADAGTALRIFVSPGGCSGMQYGMTLDDQEQEGDQFVDHDGARLVVDEMSAMYLTGAEVDYTEALMGGGFSIQNPNAAKSCACGHSFDTGQDAVTARVCH
jgi:iron-sulfur cluster assembly protein